MQGGKSKTDASLGITNDEEVRVNASKKTVDNSVVYSSYTMIVKCHWIMAGSTYQCYIESMHSL